MYETRLKPVFIPNGYWESFVGVIAVDIADISIQPEF